MKAANLVRAPLPIPPELKNKIWPLLIPKVLPILRMISIDS